MNDQKCRALVGVPTGIEDAQGIEFSVSQNEPNPAYGITQIHYVIPQSGKVRFELRNTLGQLVQTSEEDRTVGNNMIEVNAQKLSNGVYYYTVEFDKKRITRKMVVNQ